MTSTSKHDERVAVLTTPILVPLADHVNMGREVILNAY
jgi:uncharacterized ion transporter superfamily protein YfcC